MTFDDGFDLIAGGALDVLNAHGVKATSFVLPHARQSRAHVAQQAERGPRAARRPRPTCAPTTRSPTASGLRGRPASAELIGLCDGVGHGAQGRAGRRALGRVRHAAVERVPRRAPPLLDRRRPGTLARRRPRRSGCIPRRIPIARASTPTACGVEILDPARRLCTDLGQASVAFSYPFGRRCASCAVTAARRGRAPRLRARHPGVLARWDRSAAPRARIDRGRHAFLGLRQGVPRFPPFILSGQRAGHLCFRARMTGYLGMDLPRFLAIVRGRRWLILGNRGGGDPARARVVADPAEPVRRQRGPAVRPHDQRRTRSSPGATTDTTDVPERDGRDEPRARLAGHRRGERQAPVPGSGDGRGAQGRRRRSGAGRPPTW